MKLASFITAIFLLICSAAFASVKPLVTDVSKNNIEIDSTFAGTNILLFGSAVQEGNLYIVLRGPDKNFDVRMKEKIGGIWVNTKTVQYNNIPSLFYAYSASFNRKLVSAFSNELNIPSALSYLTDKSNETEFDKAFRTNQIQKQMFADDVQQIYFMGETLFKTSIEFPSSITQGVYTVEVYLYDLAGNMIAFESIPITVKKIGIDAKVYNMSQNHPAWYGIIAIMIALSGGWFASYIFKKYNI